VSLKVIELLAAQTSIQSFAEKGIELSALHAVFGLA
jgi:hypothetical protein